jgi:predicted transcriptional regulator
VSQTTALIALALKRRLHQINGEIIASRDPREPSRLWRERTKVRQMFKALVGSKPPRA